MRRGITATLAQAVAAQMPAVAAAAGWRAAAWAGTMGQAARVAVMTRVDPWVPEPVRWWLWERLAPLPGVCPSNAHTALICAHPDRPLRLHIDAGCRRDRDDQGACYCGHLMTPGFAARLEAQ